MRDTQVELGALLASEAARVSSINEQRRHAATHKSEVWIEEIVSPLFIAEIKELSVVLNLHYEAGLRGCFESAVTDLHAHIESAKQVLELALGR